MYSRAEASHIKQSFWTAFGRYLSPLPNSEGLKINWVNYHTGYKHFYFRMEADQKNAYIAITLNHPDEQLRNQFFDKLEQLHSYLSDTLGEEWHWQRVASDEQGRGYSRIYMELNNVSIYNQSDWPAIISFFKPRIMGLDSFWNDVKDAFEEFG